ncbi:MAG: Holliday junction resolvase RuvX [Clostridia bacterium]|nr:Holliday junction resolvase RuvX [Clostridia bacterium]
MIIMSVDYGDVRTGIAICDVFEMLASPVCVIKETYAPKLIDKISELTSKHKPELIVVGCPVNMDGTSGHRAEKCLQLSQMIQEQTKIETRLWDERMTTIEAHRALNVTNTRGKKRKAVIDEVAATIILQDYLDFRKNNKKMEN